MVKKINSKSTKAEILEAFEELQQENSGLQSQVRKLNKEKQAVVENPVKAVKQSASAEVRPSNNGKTAQQKVNQTIQSLELLQQGFGSAASELSEQLTQEAAKLKDLEALVSQEVEELQELHDLEEVEEDTLDTLLETYQERAKSFEQEIGDRQETLDQQIQDLKTEWEKEQNIHQRQIKERNENHHKERQRDEEEYRYNLELERNLDTEEYEQNKKLLYQELEETRLAQEKEWQERETEIAEREKQYAEAKAKVEEHPKKLEENIKNGKENGRNIGNYQAKVSADLRAKEIEGLKRSYELQITSLEASIKDREARIQTLTKQLEAALKQVQDLAVKAIEGSSNANSFQALREIAVEQAKNQPKSK